MSFIYLCVLNRFASLSSANHIPEQAYLLLFHSLLWWWIPHRTFFAASNHYLFQLNTGVNMIFIFSSSSATNSILFCELRVKESILWLFSRSAILCHIVAVFIRSFQSWWKLISLKIDFSRRAPSLHHSFMKPLECRELKSDDWSRKTHFISLVGYIFCNLVSVVAVDEIMYSITI